MRKVHLELLPRPTKVSTLGHFCQLYQSLHLYDEAQDCKSRA